jgi:hypothetical protein
MVSTGWTAGGERGDLVASGRDLTLGDHDLVAVAYGGQQVHLEEAGDCARPVHWAVPW